MSAMDILNTPTSEAQLAEYAVRIEKGKKEAWRKDRAVVKDLSSRGFSPSVLADMLTEIDRAYASQEWPIVMRQCADLIHAGVDWVPTLFARAALSCCFTSNQDTILSYADRSFKYYPEQAPAYLALAFCKKSVGRPREAVHWLQLAKLGLNNHESIWKTLHAELSWGVHVENKRMFHLWNMIKSPNVMRQIAADPRYSHQLRSVDIPAAEAGLKEIAENPMLLPKLFEDNINVRLFLTWLWPMRLLLFQPFPIEATADKSQGESAFSGFSYKLFQTLLTYDQSLIGKLGGTCKTFFAWSNSPETWTRVCEEIFHFDQSNILLSSDCFHKYLTIFYSGVKEVADTILQPGLSADEWSARGRLLIEKYGGSSQGMFWTPYRPVLTKLVDWMSLDMTTNIAHRFYRRARLVPALLTVLSKTDVAETHRAVMGALSALVLRIGDEVVRELDFYGARSLVRNVSGTSVMRESYGVLAAMASVEYFRKVPLAPVFPSNLTINTSSLSELGHYSTGLSGLWHLIMVDNNSKTESEYEHAVCNLKFDDTDGTLEGSGRGTLGPFVLTPGKSCFAMETVSIFFSCTLQDSQSTRSTIVFEGTSQPMGWCGTYGYIEGKNKAKVLEQYMGQAKPASPHAGSSANGANADDEDEPKTSSSKLLTNTDFVPKGAWILCRSPGDFNEALFEKLGETALKKHEEKKAAKEKEAADAKLQLQLEREARRQDWLEQLRNASKAVYLLTLAELSVHILNDIQASFPPIADVTTQYMKNILPPLPVLSDEPEVSYKRRAALLPSVCGVLHDLRKAMVGEYSVEEVDADIAVLKFSLIRKDPEATMKQNGITCAALNRWYRRLNLSAFEVYGNITTIPALVQFLEEAQSQLQANGRKTFMTDNTIVEWSNHFVSHGRRISDRFGEDGGANGNDLDVEDEDDIDDPFNPKKQKNKTVGWSMLSTVAIVAISVTAVAIGAFVFGRSRTLKSKKSS